MSYDTLDPSTLNLLGVRVKARDQLTFHSFLRGDHESLIRTFEAKEVTMQVRWNPDPFADIDWQCVYEGGWRCKWTRRGPRPQRARRYWSKLKILGRRRGEPAC